MRFFRTCVSRPITVIMAVLAIILLGFISLTKLPVDLFPKIDIPYIIVDSYYEGAGPKEMENMVTKPLEEAIATIGNLKKIESISSSYSSLVIAELNMGTDMDFAALEVRDKIDEIRSKLPKGATKPSVMKINPNDSSVFEIGVIMEGDIDKAKHFTLKKIKPRLERINGVGSVKVFGGREKHVKINIDNEKLIGYGITVDYIGDKLKNQNLNWPSGIIKSGTQEFLIRTLGELKTVEEIKELMIFLPNGEPVGLEELGSIEYVDKKENSVAKVNGKEWINISIKKQSGANIVAVGSKINKEIEKMKEEFPQIELKVIFDQSKIIKVLIKNVAKSAVVGGILAIVVLYVFLMNIRTTFIVGLSLPIAIIATFVMMFLSKVSINMMTLGGLALGVGMLVDNSIVVLENIYRYRQSGHSKFDAAVKGVSEVGLSVIASTLTTVVVFLPIVFLKGFIAELFKDLALSVSFSLMASLIVALTVVPVLSSILLKVEDMDNKKLTITTSLLRWFDKGYKKFADSYRKKLEWGLNHKKTVIVISTLVFLLSLVSMVSVGYELFPPSDDGYFTIKITLPKGMKVDDTIKIAKQVEDRISDIKEIETLYSVVGSDGESMASENEANLTVELIDIKKRDRSLKDVANEVRKRTKSIAGAKIRLETSSAIDSASGKKAFVVNIYGDNYKSLSKISDDFVEIIKMVEGIEDVKSSLTNGSPEVKIVMDKERAVRYGVDTSYASNIIQKSLIGAKVSKLKKNGREIDIRISGDGSLKESMSTLKGLNVVLKDGISIPIESFTDIEISRGPVSINKERQQIKMSISSNVYGRDLGSISKDVKDKLKNYSLPQGYYYKIGGQSQEMDKSFKDLGMVLVVSVILVYMILASQFESLLNPFIIILSVPLAFGGGAIGLFVFNKTMSVPAIIGAIVLSGVVVNDAILLIDYINIRRNNGESRHEAIVNAGPIRLRPILMTTLTTVLALVPMLIVEKAKTLAPMAAVVTGGLILSDVLILVFVPVIYVIFDDIKAKYLKTEQKDITIN